MNTFSIGETSIAGLRVLKNRPVTILYWLGLMLLLGVAAAALILPILSSTFADLSAQTLPAATEAKRAATMIARMFGAFGLLIPLELVFLAVMATAANRAVLEPQRQAFGYLRLGMEEMRTLVVMICLGVIVLAAYVALIVLFSLAGAVAIGVGASKGGPAVAILGVLFMILGVIAIFVGLFWFMTRMSLAIPQTFATKRVNIFGTWSLTKDVTGSLFLAYLLAFLIYLALSMVGGIVNVIAMGGSVASMAVQANAKSPPDLSRLFASMGPAMIANMVVSAVVGAVGTAVMICPSAAAYRELGGRTEREAEVFA